MRLEPVREASAQSALGHLRDFSRTNHGPNVGCELVERFMQKVEGDPSVLRVRLRVRWESDWLCDAARDSESENVESGAQRFDGSERHNLPIPKPDILGPKRHMADVENLTPNLDLRVFRGEAPKYYVDGDPELPPSVSTIAWSRRKGLETHHVGSQST
jgi:hypothetical protein